MSSVEGAAKRAPKSDPVSRSAGKQLDVVLQSLDDSKAEEIVAIPLEGKSSIADHMVVASGRSNRHVGATAERLISDLKNAGFGKARVEGIDHCDWVLIDCGDVIVHIFRPEVRTFYNLEKMWLADFSTLTNSVS
ncbi:MAG: ribosome silencing factor [Fimbriimonadaceae bacterium]|nr:ribosome silencing factor [Alphaproteobacteria bacterium]